MRRFASAGSTNPRAFRLFHATPNLRALSSMFVDAWKKGIRPINDVKSAGFTVDKGDEISDECTDGTSAMLNAIGRFRTYMPRE
jgi:hypothetical protein